MAIGNGFNPVEYSKGMWDSMSFEDRGKAADKNLRQPFVSWDIEGPGYLKRGYTSEYLHITCSVHYMHPTKGERLYLAGYGDWGAEFSDLRITAQGDKRSWKDGSANGSFLYGWGVEYDPVRVGLDDAERMVKLLRKVKRGLARLEESEGRVQTFGQYVNRVARVLGMKAAKRWRENGAAGGFVSLGQMADDIEYQARYAASKAWGKE